MKTRQPQSLLDFLQLFSGEPESIAYLEAVRWPDRFTLYSAVGKFSADARSRCVGVEIYSKYLETKQMRQNRQLPDIGSYTSSRQGTPKPIYDWSAKP